MVKVRSVFLAGMFLTYLIGPAINASGQTPGTTPVSSTTQPATARQLYGQAAQALVTKDISLATSALAELIDQYPQDEMAPLAAMRLAQCHMTASKSTEAISVLEQWLPELSKSTQARTLDPAAELDARAMLAKAYLMTAQYDRVIELAKETATIDANPAALSAGQQRALHQLKGFATAAFARREAGQADLLREAARLVREKCYSSAQVQLDKVDGNTARVRLALALPCPVCPKSIRERPSCTSQRSTRSY